MLRAGVCRAAVHVPDRDVGAPNRTIGARGGGCGYRRVAVPHLKLRVRDERGELDPHKRLALRVPGVDLVRVDRLAVLRGENEVAAVYALEIVVGEALDSAGAGRKAHKDREVGMRDVLGIPLHLDRRDLGVTLRLRESRDCNCDGCQHCKPY